MNRHILYKTGDKYIPESIKDRNNEVVLSMCKVCGKAESELIDSNCITKELVGLYNSDDMYAAFEAGREGNINNKIFKNFYNWIKKYNEETNTKK